MASRLVGEVLDHCPDLPRRQFRVLVALALDASDATRQAKPGHELLARRGNCSVRTVGRAIDGLAARGLVKIVAYPGHKHRTVYAILPMPGTPDTSMAEDTSANDVADDDRPERRPSAGERRPSERRTSDNDVAGSFKTYLPIPTVSGTASAAPTAQAILAAFIDWDRARGGQLTQRTIGQLATHISGLLAEGIAEQHIKRGLIDWRDRRQHPSTLHSFVDAASSGQPAARSRRDGERQARWARQLERARAADAAAAGELT
jgi:hypothetical protein